MITFQQISYQNFLASGNVPIVIDLTAHPTTLIVGINGTGKSTMSEAISFALFGRALRSINKPQLVNNINQRECLVELEFTTIAGQFKVRRGIKPTVFEIYRNGVLEPMPANMDDYQETLESILKLDYKSFKQVVILGSASYVPFMRLTATQRRDIIEDLLDIEVFSSMNALAKEDLSEVKSAIDKTITLRKALSDQIAMAASYTDLLEQQNLAALQGTEAGLQALQAEDDGIRADLAAIELERAPYATASAIYAKASAKEREFERTLYQLHAKLKELKDKHAFYADHDNCPECEQVISDDFTDAKVSELADKEQAVEKAITECTRLLTVHRTRAQEAQAALTQDTRLETEAKSLHSALVFNERSRRSLQTHLVKLQQPIAVPAQVDVVDLNKKLDEATAAQNAHASTRVILDAATMLLKDNGIKTKVIKHYLPIINRQINHYLTAMDFPILFTFDESFNETMKSRHRADFSYESFSEGEKKRIDIALLLTWRAVAKLKNSASTNLLILDEVLDSSLDAAGIEDFMKIMQALESGTNAIVISHRTDQLVDKFAHTIQFETYKQFSRIKP